MPSEHVDDPSLKLALTLLIVFAGFGAGLYELKGYTEQAIPASVSSASGPNSTSEEKARNKSGELVPLKAANLAALLIASHKPVTIMNIWATWCPPCRTEMPEFLKFKHDSQNREIGLILVSADEKSDARAAEKFLQSVGVDFLTYILDENPQAFILALKPDWNGGLPATFLLDAKGHVLDYWTGSTSRTELDQKLARFR